MSSWFTSLLFAILMTVIPFTFVLRILSQLPAALAGSHRRWPMALNSLVIAVVTMCVAVFVRATAPANSQLTLKIGASFLIVALVYAFGLVLILRQYCGVYPDYIVTVSWIGLGLRKTSYRNIEDVEHVVETGGEIRFRIHRSGGSPVILTLPAQHGATFYGHLRKKLNGG